MTEPARKVKLKSVKKESQKRHMISMGDDGYNHTVAPSLEQKVRVVPGQGQIEKRYQRGRELGLGAFSNVFLGTHRASKKEYAIKKIDREKMMWGDSRDALEDEVNHLIQVREGPNIVQLYEVYEEKSHCYLVMELMYGGELFDRILERKNFSEKAARDCIRCVLTGLDYLHEKRLAHRDLKPENLLLTSETNDTEVKLADFGFSKIVKKQNECRTLCGTPGYMAPEILERWPAYDTKCDLWSVGVILFLLLGGYLPFDDDDEDKVFERTRNGQYFFHPAYWKLVSKGAKGLVTKLLTVNPNKRISASEALEHEWMQRKVDEGEMDTNLTNIDTLKENVQKGKNKPVDPNRLNNLQENFAGFLDRQRLDSKAMRITPDGNAHRAPQKKFVEEGNTGKKFADCYELGEVLGEGGYACVYRATHLKTKEVYAVKDVNTDVLEENSIAALKEEIVVLKLLRGGPHIIRLYDVFEEEKEGHTYLVMEEMKGGDLLTRITDKEVYTEREARKTCKIIFQAMDYLHKMKICHRDIKPENILMVEQDDDTSIKIADFGFAKKVTKANCLRTLCGTAQYVAPEVLDLQSGGYDHRADMWSVGVVIYILLGGYAPFEGPVQELARAICKADYCFHDKYWSDISDAAKGMISSLLEIDVERRLSAEEALQCPWMTIEEESLTAKDLSGAKEALTKRKQEEGNAKPTGVLDERFISGMGTFDQVMDRQAKRTTVVPEADLKKASEDKSIIEDSSSGKAFEVLYEWGKQLDEGDFGELHESKHKQSKQVVAVKRITRTDLHPSDAVALQDEISALRMVADCSHIINLLDVFEEPDYTYMVFERLHGGELIDRIIKRQHYDEKDARQLIKGVLLGVEYCHNRRIAIRNLKAESLLCTSKDNDIDVKISDFSFAKRVLYPNSLQTQCGTEGYVAPEILEHRPAYDVQCDMWSLGVILYILLGGYRPFRGEGETVMRLIRYGEFKFHKRYWKDISEEPKILISRMLTVNPIGRITATGALQSDWVKMSENGSRDNAPQVPRK